MASSEWEQNFRHWAKPPTSTEQTRCDNAVSVVRNGLSRSAALAGRSVSVFAKGSYRNGTNVAAESDVDVGVRCNDVFFFDLPLGISTDAAGIYTPAHYTFLEFRADVVAAMKDYLGAAAVTEGDKCIDLHANTYRVDADVVPTFEYRRYFRDSSGKVDFHSGTALRPLSGHQIINWPEQNYRNGTDKNRVTHTRFKKVVRILKRLRFEMSGAGIAVADRIPSYLIECLVWHAPLTCFGHDSYTDDVREVLAYLYAGTKSDGACHDWTEVNGLKWLFRSSQPWTQHDANQFIVEAWRFVGVL